MAKATYVPTSPAIDFSQWTFLAGPGPALPNGEYAPHPGDIMLAKIITPIIAGEFEKDPPQAYLPFEWHETDGNNGPSVDDPLTIDFELPLGTNDCECPVWRISFRAIVDDLADLHVLRTGPDLSAARQPPFYEEEGERLLTELANALRDEADRIEDIIRQGPKSPAVGD